MKKLKKIVSDRKWYHTSNPLNVFESRLQDMLDLETSAIASDLPNSAKNESRKQYLVMLVVCYETYVREMFKKIIEQNLVPISKISKLKNFKDTKFTIEELEFIRKHKIKLSEILCQYINFQNFGELINSFSIINLDKKVEEKIKQKDDIMPLPDSVLTKKDNVPSKIVTEFFKHFVLHKKSFNKWGLYKQINLLLEARHKIIHRNIDIKIEQDDVIMMTTAIYEFIIILDRVIQDISSPQQL